FLQGRIGAVDGSHATVDLEGGSSLQTDFPAPPATGTAVTVGIRPEDLVPVAPGQGVLTGDVQIAEQLGGETYVYITLPNGGTLTAEIKGQAALNVGERLDLAIDSNKFHIFGADEKVIRHA
ncbi:MAG: TOBE domain-containing protein, partial [Geminicoccaceae bacterium]|nr:TOBE domain-containing protein [Geminicoccaceae bacterium]